MRRLPSGRRSGQPGAVKEWFSVFSPKGWDNLVS